jgi:hypothetical protein
VSNGKIRSFLTPAIALAVLSGSAVFAVAWLGEGVAPAWALAGWGSAAVIGVVGGSWLAAWHGRPGWGFVVALLAGMLARLLAVGSGAALAALAADGAPWVFAGGFAAGFIPLQVWEAVFFQRASRELDRVGEPPTVETGVIG